MYLCWVLQYASGPGRHDRSKHRYLTMRLAACFLMELCLFYELKRRLCPWAPNVSSSLWHGAGHVPRSEEDSNGGPDVAVSGVGAFALST